MTIIEAIQKRHSVRRYTDQSVEHDILAALLGIVKYHFEIGAGTDNFKWADPL